MELKRDEIIKDLECCKFGKDEAKCKECNWHPWIKPRCWRLLASNSLALINELTEENERLRKQLDDRCDRCIESDKARTVMEMTKLLIRRLPIISPGVFKGIANEMLEGKNDVGT